MYEICKQLFWSLIAGFMFLLYNVILYYSMQKMNHKTMDKIIIYSIGFAIVTFFIMILFKKSVL